MAKNAHHCSYAYSLIGIADSQGSVDFHSSEGKSCCNGNLAGLEELNGLSKDVLTASLTEVVTSKGLFRYCFRPF